MLANHEKQIKGRGNQNSKQESTSFAKRRKKMQAVINAESCKVRENMQQLPRAGKRATVAKGEEACNS